MIDALHAFAALPPAAAYNVVLIGMFAAVAVGFLIAAPVVVYLDGRNSPAARRRKEHAARRARNARR